MAHLENPVVPGPSHCQFTADVVQLAAAFDVQRLLQGGRVVTEDGQWI